MSYQTSFEQAKTMSKYSCTALAHPNIALVKYWGNTDDHLRIPSNGSISMNLDGLHSITTVTFDTSLKEDCLFINGKPAHGTSLTRVSGFLDLVREMAGKNMFASVSSHNNFPSSAGLASSASAFASLSLAASRAIGLDLPEKEISRLARRGSGSACRSIPSGFVEWYPGTGDSDSYAVSFAPPETWHLVDCIAILQQKKKAIGSTEGHRLAATSPLQQARVVDTPRRLMLCKQAILERDFEKLAFITEQDSNMMHAIMLTSSPSLLYWEPATIKLMKMVPLWRNEGIPACYTIDAGANVHVITTSDYASNVVKKLESIYEVQCVFQAGVGLGARILETGSIINPV